MAGSRKSPTTVVREEAWAWLEASLGWMPGRTGRIVRRLAYRPFIASIGFLDVAEHTGPVRAGTVARLPRARLRLAAIGCRLSLTDSDALSSGHGRRLGTGLQPPECDPA